MSRNYVQANGSNGQNEGSEEDDKSDVFGYPNHVQHDTPGSFSKNALRRRSRLYVHRQCRIIVRNLSYKITDQKLRSEFKQYGELEEVNILKRPDGKLVGCAFLQFSNKEESDQAIEKMNNQMFMGRKIQVHYALDKLDFSKMKTKQEIKKEEIKQEDSQMEEDDEVQIKEESEDDDGSDEDDQNEDERDDDDDDEENDDDSNATDDSDDEKPIIKKENKNEIEEGRTVFLKNVPYDVKADELKQLMSQFGMVAQVLINKERISGHSKGTAFVIFKLKDSAELSCRQNLKLQLHEQFLEILPALRKKDIKEREKAKEEKRAKDSRNLYLLKEGLIMAGSPAAKDVSKADMAQRLRLEQRTNEMLKNYNRFVARERLTIHNIPDNYSNEELRKTVIKFTSQRPKECRVMRDTRPSFGNPVGRSRGYGFLSFARHETALEVLRKLNNNPAVFGKNSRPIVSFSIEDRNVYNIRQKRLEKSRLNNPTYQKKMEELKMKKLKKLQIRKEARRQEMEQLAVAPGALLQKLNLKTKDVDMVPKKKQRKRDIEHMVTSYTGELSKEGRAGIRSNRKIAYQADAHMKRIKQEKKEQKKKKLKQEQAKNRKEKVAGRVKPKLNLKELKKEDAFFKQTVGKYKEMINHVTKQPTRSKWYTE
ncbi:RNA-binding protein 28 [Anopheles nili]|uniref:RNA-binding protein 28 n=1 Tax=Anopheles nili TaxID=185578 RepID=UPI00237AC9D7|nr:RNA-binding protein 28 [Anopheles nili]